MNTSSSERSQLSLNNFHLGQDFAGSDIQKALHYFTLSLEDARSGGMDEKIVGEDWENYIKQLYCICRVIL